MPSDYQNSGLGRMCPRCKKFTVIFSGHDLDGVHLLPVKGRFSFPCAHCAWSMDCDTRLLEEINPTKKKK